MRARRPGRSGRLLTASALGVVLVGVALTECTPDCRCGRVQTIEGS